MRNSELAHVYAVLNQLYPNQQISKARKLKKGFSNHNYYFEHGADKRLLKLFAGDVPVTALQVQQQLAELGSAQSVIYVDEQEKVAVLEYLTATSYDADVSKELIRALATIHRCNVPKTANLDLAHSLIEAAAFMQLDNLANDLIQQLSHWPSDIRYCHNDLVKDNVLETCKGVYIIDFEYAQHNDLYFDLAALCCSFSLNSQQKQALLDDYYAECKESTPSYAGNKLETYIGCYLIVSIAWYQRKHLEAHCAPLEQLLNKWLKESRKVLPRK
ncbi:hypothetical protein A7985_24850 [Pseudoalteromonas luteoviolacea]|uniref:Aminoglycoside phosphotransferase domain-containing protein n=1 Tax=Pseudoalteromonas luteoviolacea TaxID=43657 RepID=A0A1C0TIZ4_9GAMM|nr:phosphotransferase [Pseudoalteromonas luteoviolacea]OCQ18174.1 hypothetical protein A7985_24850 [Pseudoalteromonas luteoviolacea]